MIEVFANMWFYIRENPVDFICIPTNGTVKSNGSLVMGRGVAAQAKGLFPGVDYLFGGRIRDFGNHVHVFYNVEMKGNNRRKYNLISFPTKRDDYRADSDLVSIKKSTEDLLEIIQVLPTHKILLPRPGCGNGNLNWEDVKPIVSVLPDTVYIIERRSISNA